MKKEAICMAACLTLACLGRPVPLRAQTFERMPAYEEQLYGELAYVSGDYGTMRNIRNYWQRQCVKLHNMRGCEFALCGNGDAILRVTIPARMIYVPNDTVLATHADASLRPLLHLLRGDSPMAQLIVACHSDNNGSEAWLDASTAARARSVERWLRMQGVRQAKVYTYGLGAHSPRANNETIASRERNRRLTLYLIPAKEMLKRARRDKLDMN